MPRKPKSPPLVQTVAELNAHRRLWRVMRQFEIAAELQEREHAERGLEPGQVDTLPRVRLRPVGHAVRRLLGRGADDDLADLYDPDAITRTFYKPAEDWEFMRSVPVKAGKTWLDPIGHHRLQIPYMEQVKDRWVLKHHQRIVRSGEALKDLSETQEYRRARVLEATGDWVRRVSARDYKRLVEGDMAAAFEHGVTQASRRLVESGGFDFNNEPNRGLNPMGAIDQEYIPLSGGSYSRQLYLYAHWEQTSKAFYERHHSELAKASIGIVSDFVLGRGIAWKIENVRAREVWQDFWDREKMEWRIRQLSDDLSWQGELLIRLYEQPKGFLCIRSLDPGAFNEIVTDPQDVESVFWYSLTSPTPWQLMMSYRGRNVNVPTLQYVIQQYPPNEMLHIKNNVSATEKWGRSDFFTSLGTLKRHRDWMNAVTLRDMLQANLVWKIKVHGDQSDADAFVNDPANAQLPANGGTWVENDALELSPMHQDVATGGGRNTGTTGQFLTALFATAQNMPLSYFNSSTQGNARATALTQGEPFVKKIATRQQTFRQLLDRLYQEVMQRAVAAGRLAADVIRHEDADPDWIFPSAYEEDRGAKLRDLKIARDAAVISHQSFATQVAQELGLAEYDYDDEQQSIAEERTERSLETWPLGTEVAVTLGVPPQGMPAGEQLGKPAVDPDTMPHGGGASPGGQNTPHQALDTVMGRGEELKGADERHAFRRQWTNHSLQSLSESDAAFLDSIVATLKRGDRVRLPSGRVARVRAAVVS